MRALTTNSLGLCGLALLRGVPGETWDVRAADADIGQFAIAEPGQFVQAAVVVVPGLDEADEGGKHGVLFLCRLRPGGSIWAGRSNTCKIVKFQRLKRNYAALQLIPKRIAQGIDY